MIQPALSLLHKLGYAYLSPSDNLALRRGKTSKIILEEVLKSQFEKLNAIQVKGQQHAFSDNNFKKAMDAFL